MHLALSIIVQASQVTVGPDNGHVEIYELDGGDDIIWEWEVVNDRNIDFWIQDSQGTRHLEVYNATSSRGSFEVPTDGTWTVVFHNDDFYSSIVDYTITVDTFGGSVFYLTLILVILIVVIILLVVMLQKKKERSS
jgi:hypothetical protein